MLSKITNTYYVFNEAEMAESFSFFFPILFLLWYHISLYPLILAMRGSQPTCSPLTKEEPVYAYLIFSLFL